MITSHANFLLSLGWAILNSLWQLALLWVIYQFIVNIYTRSSATFRARLAVILLLSGFGWFIITFFIAFAGNNEDMVNTTALLLNTEMVYPLFEKILLPASIIYLCLLVIPVSRFIKNYRYVQVIRKYGLLKADAQWRLFVKTISGHMNIRHRVTVWVSEFISSPVTVGWLKPVILLPAAVITQLSPLQVEALLLHELAHIRRYDYLVNLVINFIRTILYYNPFATAFIKIVEKEREKSCDEMVLQFQYNPHEYASALLQLQQTASQPQTFVVAATGKNELLQRVELIMGMKQKQVMPAGRVVCILAFVITGVLLFSSIVTEKQNTNYTGNTAFLNTAALVKSENLVLPDNSLREKTEATIKQRQWEKANYTNEDISTESAETIPAGLVNNNTISDAIIHAGFEIVNDIPALKKYQEEQIRKTIEASKKVLSNAQWAAVDKELADLFSRKEKKELQKKYRQQVEKFDWKSWENKLKAAYDNVDWERVNNQMNQAISMIRLDSLQRVYSDAVAQLDITRKELLMDSVKSIPDSDISLKTLDKKIKAAITAISDIKATRKKKTIHL